MKYLPLTKGFRAIIDDADYELVRYLRWHADVRPHTVYASTSLTINGKRKEIRLHTFLMLLQRVDHKNHNGLDNRRQNLRAATQQENVWNSVGMPHGISKGVTLVKRLRKRPWQARIAHNYLQVHLGYFATLEEATIAYGRAAIALRGEFAYVNDKGAIKCRAA